jgi:hypothetical protein
LTLADARARRIKLLVHRGFGIWYASRRLHAGRFAWLPVGPNAAPSSAAPSSDIPALERTQAQVDALVLGLT